MSHPIHLAIFSNGTKPAHHAIFIPTPTPNKDKATLGKIIHVTGNPATGFFLEFKRNYDFAFEQRRYQLIPLAEVNALYIRDTTTAAAAVGDDQQQQQEYSDTIARDRLESVATTVLPPGRSVNPFDPLAPNCQNWMRDYVQKLVAEGLVPSSAGLVVERAPRLL